MLERNDVMNTLYKGIAEMTDKFGFAPVFPEGVKKNELPLKARGENACFIDYVGKSGKLRLLYRKASRHAAENSEPGGEGGIWDGSGENIETTA